MAINTASPAPATAIKLTAIAATSVGGAAVAAAVPKSCSAALLLQIRERAMTAVFGLPSGQRVLLLTYKNSSSSKKQKRSPRANFYHRAGIGEIFNGREFDAVVNCCCRYSGAAGSVVACNPLVASNSLFLVSRHVKIYFWMLLHHSDTISGKEF